jgi:SAM-dependent methyltransferase
LSFLAGWLSGLGAESFLDLACGTGGYALAVAATGRPVVGIDLSPAMIRQAQHALAREQAARASGAALDMDATFLVGDIRDLAGVSALHPAPFASAACIGNSLAHLLTDADLDRCLGEIARVLSPRRGALLLQVVNYDGLELCRTGATATLPAIERPAAGLQLRRAYAGRADGLADFRIDLRLGDGRELSGTLPIRPWLRTELVAALDRAGFGPAECFGGFDLRPHDRSAPATVLAAKL